MMALEYTRTPYKLVPVDPRKGDTKTAEFKKVHGTVDFKEMIDLNYKFNTG